MKRGKHGKRVNVKDGVQGFQRTARGKKAPDSSARMDSVKTPVAEQPTTEQVSAMYRQYESMLRTSITERKPRGPLSRLMGFRRDDPTISVPDQLRDASGASFSDWQLYEHGVSLPSGEVLVATSRETDADLLVLSRGAGSDDYRYGESQNVTYRYVTKAEAVELLAEKTDRDYKRRVRLDEIRAAQHQRELSAAQAFIAEHDLPISAQALAAPGLTFGSKPDSPRAFIIEREGGRMDYVFKQYSNGVGHSVAVGNGMTVDEFVSILRSAPTVTR